jgi:hypothetical protein
VTDAALVDAHEDLAGAGAWHCDVFDDERGTEAVYDCGFHQAWKH